MYFYSAHVDKHHSSAPAMLVSHDGRGAVTSSHSGDSNRHAGAMVKSESSSSSDDCSSGSQSADADSDRDEGVRDEERGQGLFGSVPLDQRSQSGDGRQGKDEKMKDKEKARMSGTVVLHRAVSKSIMRRRRASLYFGGIALIYQVHFAQQ